jgi:hypothetical protein
MFFISEIMYRTRYCPFVVNVRDGCTMLIFDPDERGYKQIFTCQQAYDMLCYPCKIC